MTLQCRGAGTQPAHSTTCLFNQAGLPKATGGKITLWDLLSSAVEISRGHCYKAFYFLLSLALDYSLQMSTEVLTGNLTTHIIPFLAYAFHRMTAAHLGILGWQCIQGWELHGCEEGSLGQQTGIQWAKEPWGAVGLGPECSHPTVAAHAGFHRLFSSVTLALTKYVYI